MKTLVVAAALMVFMLAYHHSDAVPVDKAIDTQQGPSNKTNKEAIYLLKQVSYEVGLVDTLNTNNASDVVIVKPADRIETDDISIWTTGNVTGLNEENVFASTTPLTDAAGQTTDSLPSEPANMTAVEPAESAESTTDAVPAEPEEVASLNTTSAEAPTSL